MLFRSLFDNPAVIAPPGSFPRSAPGVPVLGVSDRRVLRIGTKADRVTHHDVDLAISAITGQGLDALRQKIAERLADRAVALGGEVLALGERHIEAINQSVTALYEARQMLALQRDAHALADMELIAGVMRQALDALGRISGQITPDEVIGRVFATFCVGK